jgi:hypothetical protein
MANYYVSSSFGSSGNSGTLPTAPWDIATAKAKDAGTHFAPGDNIYFYKGDSITCVWNFVSSGSAGNPITFDLFGTATNNAVLDGGGSTSPVLSITGGHHIVIKNLVIRNSTSGNGIIFLGTATHDITFQNCYINTGIRGINAMNCGSGGVANLLITGNYFTNITDIDDGTGKFKYGGGNHIQLNTCSGSGIEISYNQCYTPITLGSATTPFVGDIISLFKCNGTSGSLILVHDNNVRGGGSSTPASPGGGGKAGLVLGDVGGTYQYGYNNIFVNAGASQLLVQGGTNINLSNNKAYAAQQPYTSVGLGYGNYSGLPANSNTIGGNIVNTKSSGGSQQNLYIDQTTGSANSTASGVAGGPTLALPANWSTNSPNSFNDPGAFDALLSNPLWIGSPWNTVTSSLIPFNLPIGFA